MPRNLHVRQRPGGLAHEGLLTMANRTIACNLGRSGITSFKQEGDGATPAGTFRLLFGFHRNPRRQIPASTLPLTEIDPDDGWCDAPGSANYNRAVKLPFSTSHERMWRDDRLYDVCIVLDYNIHPRRKNAGSAIFFHLTRPDGGPTEGCVAIDPREMRLLLPVLSTDSHMIIHA